MMIRNSKTTTCIPSRQAWHRSVVCTGCGIMPCISNDPLKLNGGENKITVFTWQSFVPLLWWSTLEELVLLPH